MGETKHVHNGECGGDVLFDERMVVARPSDATWPHDVAVELGQCQRCRALLGPRDVGLVSWEAHEVGAEVV